MKGRKRKKEIREKRERKFEKEKRRWKEEKVKTIEREQETWFQERTLRKIKIYREKENKLNQNMVLNLLSYHHRDKLIIYLLVAVYS